MILNPDERYGLPSASQFEQMSLCPGSWNAQLEKPDLPRDESDAATAGTRVHEALQFGIGNQYLNGQREQWLYDQCRNAEEALVNAYLPIEGLAQDRPLRERRTEVRLGITTKIGGERKLIATGRIDVGYRTDKAALITDYKTGTIQTTRASENPQVAGLCVGEYQDRPANEIYGALIQPTVSEIMTITRFTPATIVTAEEWVADIVSDALKPDAPRVAGVKQCRYCKAHGECPEAIAAALDAKPQDLRIERVKRSHVALNLPAVTGTRLAEVKGQLAYVKVVAEAVDNEIKTRLSADPSSVPNYYLKPIKKAVVSNITTALKIAGHSALSFLGVTGVTKTNLRTAFNRARHYPDDSTRDAREFEEKFAAVITEEDGGMRLTAGSLESLENGN